METQTREPQTRNQDQKHPVYEKMGPPVPNTTFNVLFKGGGNFDVHAYQGLVQKGMGMLSFHMSS